MEERLNKFIASSGVCSRRKADELIKRGLVKVNGKVVNELGIKINPEKDVIEVLGREIIKKDKKIYLKLYKPRGYLTQLGKDKFGRKTLEDLYKEVGIKDRVFPVGRLDYDSEGLLILTNDGDFADYVTHPKNNIKKTYIVKVKGRVNHKTFNRIRKGALLSDGFFKVDEVKILKKGKNYTVLEVVIHSGKKRILRRYLDYFNHPVERLKRIKIGLISLGDLKEKEWEKIDDNIINRMSKKKK
ncbi:pseudouridine synthase [Persephonella sp.]